MSYDPTSKIVSFDPMSKPHTKGRNNQVRFSPVLFFFNAMQITILILKSVTVAIAEGKGTLPFRTR